MPLASKLLTKYHPVRWASAQDHRRCHMKKDHNDYQSLVLFCLAGQRYALRLDVVVRVIRAVAVTPVPEVPAFILGLINVAGQLLPVFSLRRCLGLPDCPVRPEDQFVMVRTSRLTVALVVDEVLDLKTLDDSQMVAVEDALPECGCRAQGLVKIHGDIIFIYDLDKLISQREQERILQATEALATHP